MTTITYILCNNKGEPHSLVSTDKKEFNFYWRWAAIPKVEQENLLKKLNKVKEGDVIE